MDMEMVDRIHDSVYAAVCEAADKIKANGENYQPMRIVFSPIVTSREQRRLRRNGSFKRRKRSY